MANCEKGEVFIPIVLRGTYKMPEHIFERPVGALCLSIRLRMEGGGHTTVDAQLVLQVTPKLAAEPAVTIRDKITRITVMHEYTVAVKASHIGGSGCCECWNKVHHFGESVDHYKNCVVALLGLGEMDDKVHANTLPGLVRHGQRLEWTTRFLVGVLVGLAGRAALYVFANGLLHVGPPEKSFCQLKCFCRANVTHKPAVVALIQYGIFDEVNVRDHQAMLMAGVGAEPITLGITISAGEVAVVESRIVCVRTPNAVQHIIHLDGRLSVLKRLRHIPIVPLRLLGFSIRRRVWVPLERGCVLV